MAVPTTSISLIAEDETSAKDEGTDANEDDACSSRNRFRCIFFKNKKIKLKKKNSFSTTNSIPLRSWPARLVFLPRLLPLAQRTRPAFVAVVAAAVVARPACGPADQRCRRCLLHCYYYCLPQPGQPQRHRLEEEEQQQQQHLHLYHLGASFKIQNVKKLLLPSSSAWISSSESMTMLVGSVRQRSKCI